MGINLDETLLPENPLDSRGTGIFRDLSGPASVHLEQLLLEKREDNRWTPELRTMNKTMIFIDRNFLIPLLLVRSITISRQRKC